MSLTIPPPLTTARMTWISTTPPAGAEEALARAKAMQQALYPSEYANSRSASPATAEEGVVSSHALIPEALYHAFATFGTLMSPDLPLERRHHEMIATMVSVTNRCRY